MSNWEVGLLILLVLGVIASNLAVLKYSAKFKFPSQSELNRKWQASEDQQKEHKPEKEDISR